MIKVITITLSTHGYVKNIILIVNSANFVMH